MELTTGGKVGCGCLSAVLFFYFGVPLIMGVVAFVGNGIKEAKADFEASAERRRVEKREKAEAARAAEEAARLQAAARAEEARMAAERRASEEAQAKATADREDKLRTFALKEAPSLWQTYQALGAQIVEQGKRIEDLRKTLVEFDKNPDFDPDYKAICAQREEMVGTKESLHKKLEDAYLAFRKFEATPSHKEYDELRRRALEDGVRAADEAAKRFTIMRKEK